MTQIKEIKMNNLMISWFKLVKSSGVMASLLFSTISYASIAQAAIGDSVITPSIEHSDQLAVISSVTNSDEVFLHIRKANQAGISINRFDQFEVTGQSLKLVNVPRQVLDTTIKPASLVVIIANSIVLQNSIEMVGPATDILFITTVNNGVINCTNCTLSNFHRISLVASESTAITDNALLIGKLSTAAGGYINIDGLTAPGSIALDIASKALSLEGEINLHQYADKDVLGGYSQNINGDYSIGTGSVNALLGSLNWDYENQELVSLAYTSSLSTLGGSIKSVGVKITAANDLLLNTHINTKTDLLSSVRYKNQAHVSDEGITIQVMGSNYSLLTVAGNQQSNGNIALKSRGDLNLYSVLTEINAKEVQLIAGGNTKNLASIDADHIEIAVNKFQNEGALSSNQALEVWAEKQLVNQYGGTLVADTMKLQSKTSFVRNGSRKPYQSEEQENDDLLIFANDYLDFFNSTQLGMFFMQGVTVETTTANYVMAPDNSAHIGAREIEIIGTGFENINPYYAYVNGIGVVELQQDLIDMVTVLAEDSLQIHTTNYVLNSSAQLAMNSETGIFKIRTGMLTNERYRNETILNKYDSVVDDPNTIKTDLITLSTKTAVYSPPGVILSMGDFQVEASKGFVNNVSYLEVFDDAQFNTPILNDIGLRHGETIQNVSILPAKYKRCWRRYWRKRCRWYPTTKTNEDVTVNPTEEMDSLFFVHGNAVSNANNVFYRNHEPLNYFKNQAIQNVIEQDYAHINDGVTTTTTQEMSFFTMGGVGTATVGIDTTQTIVQSGSGVDDGTGTGEGDVLTVTVNTDQAYKVFTGTQLVPIMVGGITTFIPVNMYNDPYSETTSAVSTNYSIFEEILKLYNALLAAFTELLNEIDWWSGEQGQ